MLLSNNQSHFFFPLYIFKVSVFRFVLCLALSSAELLVIDGLCNYTFVSSSSSVVVNLLVILFSSLRAVLLSGPLLYTFFLRNSGFVYHCSSLFHWATFHAAMLFFSRLAHFFGGRPAVETSSAAAVNRVRLDVRHAPAVVPSMSGLEKEKRSKTRHMRMGCKVGELHLCEWQKSLHSWGPGIHESDTTRIPRWPISSCSELRWRQVTPHLNGWTNDQLPPASQPANQPGWNWFPFLLRPLGTGWDRGRHGQNC